MSPLDPETNADFERMKAQLAMFGDVLRRIGAESRTSVDILRNEALMATLISAFKPGEAITSDASGVDGYRLRSLAQAGEVLGRKLVRNGKDNCGAVWTLVASDDGGRSSPSSSPTALQSKELTSG